MKKLGGKVYGLKAPAVPTALWEIQEGIRILSDAGVLDKRLLFVLIEPGGKHPVVLLHEDVSKWFVDWQELPAEDRLRMPKARYDSICSTIMKYDVNWLMDQDGSALIEKNEDGLIGSPVGIFLDKVVYGPGILDPSKDNEAWRLDFIESMDPGSEVHVVEAKQVDGYAIVSPDRSKTYVVFGRTNKILRLGKE